jgi:hypothetical protein
MFNPGMTLDSTAFNACLEEQRVCCENEIFSTRFAGNQEMVWER